MRRKDGEPGQVGIWGWCYQALVLLGGGVTDIRGSIGGNTFARSAAGNYVRSRIKPVNPRSPDQNTRRANMAYLTKYWSSGLTEQQRTDWRGYATATSWTNKLGQSITINGLAAFVRLNVLHMLIPSVVVADAPEASGHGGGVTFTFSAESDTTKIQLDEPGGAFDKDENGHEGWLFMGIPAEVGKLSIPKGFKYIGRFWGSLGAPLSFPLEFDAAYTMTSGQRITCRVMYNDPQHRVSGPFWNQQIAAPS